MRQLLQPTTTRAHNRVDHLAALGAGGPESSPQHVWFLLRVNGNLLSETTVHLSTPVPLSPLERHTPRPSGEESMPQPRVCPPWPNTGPWAKRWGRGPLPPDPPRLAQPEPCGPTSCHPEPHQESGSSCSDRRPGQQVSVPLTKVPGSASLLAEARAGAPCK